MFGTITDLLRSRRNLFLTASDLRKIQITKLRGMVIFAYDNVPFYHEKLKRAGVRPTDLQTLGDLRKFPPTTKSEIQNASLNDMIARYVEVGKCVKNRTSGSTGLPLTTIASKKTDEFDQSMWLRAHFRNGMRLRDKIVVIRDLTFHLELLTQKSWIERLGIMPRKYVSIFDDPRVTGNTLTKEKPEIIESYPSSLVILANFYEDLVRIKPRLVFTLAEFLDKIDRELITRVFDTELFDYYGSAEIGLMSWECRQHLNYHINADNIVMEFISEDGENVAPGEAGEIVCTNLFNYEMPLIRYKQEDLGAVVDGNCQCGVRLPLMKLLGGRKDDLLRATNGRIMPPTIFFPYPFESFEKIKQFRVIQERKDKIKIQLVVKQSFDSSSRASNLLEKARKNIQSVFGQDMEVEFMVVENLSREPSGKLRKIISQI